jgi:hypothetical protein
VEGRESFQAAGWRVLLALVGLAACGCAEERPWPRGERVDVEGRVRVGAQPLRGGWLEFYPVGGTVGVVRSAPIGSDGTFRVTGVGRGRNVVRVVFPPPEPRVERVFQQYYSPVRPVVEPGARLDIDLRRYGGGGR